MKTNIFFKRFIKNDPSQMKDICFYPDNYKEWGLNVKLHRLDGPAMIRTDGTEVFYINGVDFEKKNYWKAVEEYKKNSK